MNVAFVCVHNSCRSQMAEAIAKRIFPTQFVWYSAGTHCAQEINPQAVQVIQKLYGVDMTKTQKPKCLSQLPSVDFVITMGCNVQCPTLPCRHREDWGLADPTGKDEVSFIQTAKEIEEKIRQFVARFENNG